MTDLRTGVLAILTVVIALTTAYSVVYETYLDTSNPLLAHLPHPLSKTHYFANKANPLNVIFIKKAWAWSSAVFTISWLTSPSQIRVAERWVKWGIETLAWLLFTSWFFGPSIFERVVIASGGECTLSLPSGDIIPVAADLCFTRTSISLESHPHLFEPTLAPLPGLEWRAFPRLRRGHDVSGHIFLLTMSALFLADQLRYSFQATRRSMWHKIAMLVNTVVITVCILAAYTTGLYFHTPQEKLSGYLLGVTAFAVSTIPDLWTARAAPKAHIN